MRKVNDKWDPFGGSGKKCTKNIRIQLKLTEQMNETICKLSKTRNKLNLSFFHEML